jgi:hypothetical protein
MAKRLRCDYDNLSVRNYPIEFESRPQVKQLRKLARALSLSELLGGYIESLYEQNAGSSPRDASNAGIPAFRLASLHSPL